MMAKSMSDHIVLVGLGRLGYRTYRMLAELGEPVVVIERDANNSFLEEVRRAGAPVIIGDARREELLHDANVKAARSIVLATSDDLANLEAALDARKQNPDIRVVVRMFDPTMAEKIRDGFQIQTAMSQSALSAPAFATAAVDASIVNSTIVNHQLIITQQWEVQPGGPLEGKSVGELMEWSNLCILERKPRDAGATLFPPPSVRLFAGGRLLVQGAYDALRKLRAEHF